MKNAKVKGFMVLAVFALIFIGLFILKQFIDSMFIPLGMILVLALSLGTISYCSNNVIDGFSLSIKDIVEIGVLVGLAIVLDMFVKIRIGANGGSISLVMVPLFIICLRKGFIKGFIATGIVFGLINCLLDGYGLQTYPFDYLLGFGSLAIIGLFRPLIINSKYRLTIFGCNFLVLSALISLCSRLLFATISGVIFYEMDFVSSLIYNVTYIGPSSAFVVVGLLILYKPLLLIEKRFPNLN